MKVLLEFPASHHYVRHYEKSELYCPNCGKREVWEEQGAGDYYQGVDYYCTSCSRRHHLDSSCLVADEAHDKLLIEQLRSGVTKEPSTPCGN